MLGRGAFSCFFFSCGAFSHAERGLVLIVYSTGDYVMNVV